MTIPAPPPARDRARRLDPARGTSPIVWALVVATVAILVVMRLPLFERLATDRTADLLDDLGDAELGAASVRVGAITAIVVFLVVTAVIAVGVGLLERWLGPRAWAPRPWLRLGVGGATIAIAAIGVQLAAVVQQVPTIGKSPLVLAAILAVAALAPLAFRDARDGRGYVRALAVTVVAGVVAWLQ